MNIEELTHLGRQFKGVTTDVKWDDHLCFNVGGKMFLILSLTSVPTTASIKVTEDEFDMLVEQEGISPAPYLARYKWVHISDISLWSEENWQVYCRKAHQLISSKLSKKKKKELGLEN